ncbi:homeobox protein unc-42-like [Sceloporus undulatus]|uniref:homeobox protein unc-42-like n=1 Tax=Sceloporus undulatus TaxID=8520 RepID=UPI001C4C4DD5|nr:homeobox protein unc-42-like [Sceloporus undulatus]
MQPSKKDRATHRTEDSEETTTAPEEQRLSRRRKRTKYEPHQVEALTNSFNDHRYPSFYELKRLEENLGIREDRLSVWFQNRRARHPESAEPKAVKQEKTRKIPSRGRAPSKRVACQTTWPGNCKKQLQPGHHWGQNQPMYQHYYYPFPQGTVNQHESSHFVTGQATSSFGSNVSFGPSVQNLPFGFGGAENHSYIQPHQSQQSNASSNSFLYYNAYSGQEHLQWFFGTPQLGGQAYVAQPEGSVSSASTSSLDLDEIISYLEEDGYTQNPSSGSSSLLYGGAAPMGREQSPTGTYSYSHSSPSSTAQRPGSSQLGTLPNQFSPINYQDDQGPM